MLRVISFNTHSEIAHFHGACYWCGRQFHAHDEIYMGTVGEMPVTVHAACYHWITSEEGLK